MRPWFTLTVIAVIACCLVAFLFVVDFVLINRTMFETTFDVVVRVPFTTLAYTWEQVQFMYIIAVGVMVGVLIIALTTLILDTKRGLKIRGMRKELKRLQQALEEAQSALPKPVSELQESSDEMIGETQENMAGTTDASASPDDISHAFEDVAQDDDFLEVAQKRREKELQAHGGQSPEGDIRAKVTGGHASAAEETETPEDAHSEDAVTDTGSVVEESTGVASTELEDVGEEMGSPSKPEEHEDDEDRKEMILADQQPTAPHDQVEVIEDDPHSSESSQEVVITVSELKESEKPARDDSQVSEHDEESDKETSTKPEVVENQEQRKNGRE